MPEMIKNIIFDFGKVLVDWNPHYLYDDYFGDEAESTRFINEVMTADFHNEGDRGTPMAEVLKMWKARFPQYSEAFDLFVNEFPKTVGGEESGMYEYLSELKARGYRLFGLSNWSYDTFRTIENVYPVFSLLEGRIISSLVHLLKPDKAIYELALSTFDIKAEESVFTDDRLPNVQGAEAAGIRGLLFKDAASFREDLEKLL